VTGPARYGADDVPRWMLNEPQSVADCGSSTATSAKGIDDAGIRLAKVLAEAGGVLGWKSPTAMAARTTLTRADGQLGQLRDLVEREAAVWSRFAAAISEHQPPLLALVKERYDLIGTFVPTEEAAPEPIKQIMAKMKVHTGALALADRTALAELRPIVDGYRALTALNREDEWVGSAAPPEVGALLARYGITESDAERALLDKLMLLPDGPEGDKELRALLATMTPAEAADFLLRHPDAARRLGGGLGPAGTYPPGSPEAKLAAAIAAGEDLNATERIALIRAAFTTMSPEEQQRLALLYPEAVGNLDGAPLPVRMAANRVKIGVALDDERQRYVDTSRAVDGQDLQWKDERRSGEPFVGVDNDETEAERNARRIDYYQKLLYEEPENPNYRAGNGRPGFAPHQILYFDNGGDGKIAEMWGTYDENTRNVGVWVPGITADMESFENTSERAYNLAYDSPNGDTVMIAWMGVDMPDSAADGLTGEEAKVGGIALRDFVTGLDVPPEKRVTAIGHSYGGAIVGSADVIGLDVDAVVHLGSVGSGFMVDNPDDYPDDDTQRYTMTPWKDTIHIVQDGPGVTGKDPDEMGFHELRVGNYSADHPDPDKAGRPISGSGDRHVDIAEARGSDAYNNILGVITGGDVTLSDGRTTRADGLPPDARD
jgi:hypothetical protein